MGRRALRGVLGLASIVVVVSLATGCGSSDCEWRWWCYAGGGGLYCEWILWCGSYPDATDLDLEATVFETPAGRLDVRVDLSGRLADGLRELSVTLAGDEPVQIHRADSATRWWFVDLPPGAADTVEVRVPGTDLLLRRSLPAPIAGFGCDPGQVFATEALPEIPESLTAGQSLLLYAPSAGELLLPGPNHGLRVTLTPPRGPAPPVLLLREGEAESVRLGEPGAWSVRISVWTANLCEPGTADEIVLLDRDLDVVP